jgi:hypothetical protein
MVKKTTTQISKEDILAMALHQQYDDIDEMHNLLALIIESLDDPDCSIYRTKLSLRALRSLMIHNQSLMMDCAGLEY